MLEDLEDKRVVTFQEGKELADFYRCPFIETSALTGENVDEAFTLIVQEMYRFASPPR